MTHATGMGSPRALHLRKCWPQCWPPLTRRNGVGVLPADHPAVDAHVHDARVGVAGHDARERVDVAPPFEIVPPGDGELRLVDRGAAEDDVLHRARSTRWSERTVSRFFFITYWTRSAFDVSAREAEHERQPVAAAERAGEEPRAAARLVALDVLEQQRRPLLLEHAARDGPDLAVPVDGGRDASQAARASRSPPATPAGP